MKRKSKYGNIKVTHDGITFDSKKEGKRYLELKLLERAGEISGLELQPSFPLEVNGKKICTYKADFAYLENGQGVIEDVKGVKTAVYRIKNKLMKAIYDIDIRET